MIELHNLLVLLNALRTQALNIVPEFAEAWYFIRIRREVGPMYSGILGMVKVEAQHGIRGSADSLKAIVVETVNVAAGGRNN